MEQTTEQSDVSLVRFHLADLYSGPEDEAIERDLTTLERSLEEFHRRFEGRLNVEMEQALKLLTKIHEDASRLMIFLYLQHACNVVDETISSALGKVRERWARASAEHYTFFEREVGALSDDDVKRLEQSSEFVRKHRSLIDHVRKLAVHRLSDPEERLLTLHAPFSVPEWKELIDETIAGLVFTLDDERLKGSAHFGKEYTLTEVLEVLNYDSDATVREVALELVNRSLGERLARPMARALNVCAGLKTVDDRERGFPHPLASRNLENRVSDEVVEALHHAVLTEGAQVARRYFALVSESVQRKPLLWSDRNAPLGRPPGNMTWVEAVDTVGTAFNDFSPTLYELMHRVVAEKWVDAPAEKNKQSGAFCYSVALGEGLGVRSYVFLNYLGTPRSVMTFAHELGHAVHGLLAGEAQGVLLFDAPLAYCETASIFAEMLTFEALLRRPLAPEEKLWLLGDKITGFLNTVVRQISFSLFEQRFHGLRADSKLTVEEFTRLWRRVTEDLYGADGDVFDYKNIDYLWSYIGHFMRPFYVYAYAFGELLTQGLIAARPRIGADFEPLYLDLLRAGGTKDAVELLQPFGLDPREPDFWVKGIQANASSWLDQAEAIHKSLKL